MREGRFDVERLHALPRPPEPPPASGLLYLAPPLLHTLENLGRMLDEEGLAHDRPRPNILVIPLGPGRWPTLGRLFDRLNPGELRDTRSLVLPAGARPDLADLMTTQPLAALLTQARGSWLMDMIARGRLAAHFQPIVRANAPDEVFAHECLLRGVDEAGDLIPPGRMYDCARTADLLFHLDRAARLTAIAEAVRHGVGPRLFINFNPSSIYDPAFCLRSTVAAVRKARLAPETIVFEIVESERSDADLPRIVRFYRDAGFRVALDDLGAGFGSLNLLHGLRPDFVKLDMELIRGVAADPYKASITARLLELARDLGVATIAEGVETEAEWAWLRAHDVDFVQGFYFARPACPPAPPRVPMPRTSPAGLAPALA